MTNQICFINDSLLDNENVSYYKIRYIGKFKYDLEARIEALEKEVYKTSKLENKENKENGPAEIRTQDPRRVKAMS